jgi:ABC-type cobalamin/Fe3+-siderophores transport system ATPase subunit
MYISQFTVTNYKSFDKSASLKLGPGFNIIVGANNTGKTALLEALSLQLDNNPHRSLLTVPNRRQTNQQASEVEISFTWGREELIAILETQITKLFLPRSTQHDGATTAKLFSDKLEAGSIETNHKYQAKTKNITVSTLTDFGPRIFSEALPAVVSCIFSKSDGRPNITLEDKNINNAILYAAYTIADDLAKFVQERIYFFKATRVIPDKVKTTPNHKLEPDASNLVQVLNAVANRQPSRFRNYVQMVNRIFPEIEWITTPQLEDDNLQLLLWPVSTNTERDDLAIPLSQSGTGIGQVMAILYLALFAEQPGVVIIDEPQSFLHPNAIRKLFEILAHHNNQQHQYILSTHSATAIKSVKPFSVLLVQKEGFASQVTSIDIEKQEQMEALLGELGMRLSDVFGADDIIWVEGPTEEKCFPRILAALSDKYLSGTKILGVINTGDFETGNSKKSELAFDLYSKLGQGASLLPPAVAFILDWENRSQAEQARLERNSGNKLRFLPRCMYENYLLNPEVLAEFISTEVEDVQESAKTLTAQEVSDWITQERPKSKYYHQSVSEAQRNSGEDWLVYIHAANFLDDLFRHFCGEGHKYSKTKYGPPITERILAKAPEDLKPLAEFLEQILSERY